MTPKTLLGTIAKRQAEERENSWVASILKACPPSTSLTWWRDSAGTIHLRITRRISLGLKNKIGVFHVWKKITLTATELFSLQQTETEEYVSALVIRVAQDMLLLRTTAWDLVLEEFCKLLEHREDVITSHSPSTCRGLAVSVLKKVQCFECERIYGHEEYGRHLRDKIDSYIVVYGGEKEKKVETGFAPNITVNVTAGTSSSASTSSSTLHYPRITGFTNE